MNRTSAADTRTFYKYFKHGKQTNWIMKIGCDTNYLELRNWRSDPLWSNWIIMSAGGRGSPVPNVSVTEYAGRKKEGLECVSIIHGPFSRKCKHYEPRTNSAGVEYYLN